MATRTQLLQSIAAAISDYRAGQIPTPDANHVERWVQQFPAGVQDPILAELDHVLSKAYCSKSNVENILSGLATTSALTGGNHASFWSTVGLLNIQGGGTSQHEMLKTFDTVLHKQFGFGITNCQASSGAFVYLDDGIFSGTRALQDLTNWLPRAPQTATVHVITIALYSGGEWHLKKDFAAAATNAGKNISLKFWCCLSLENRKSRRNDSDVLAPTILPPNPDVMAYASQLKFPVQLRQGNSVGPAKLFSSDTGRQLLEQEFLKAGVYIRKVCPNLSTALRPLGFTGLHMLGFGNVVTTFRNCPNNCPLALWVGHPWYPLLPRRTNTASKQLWSP